MNDFSKSTLRKLARKGIRLIGLQFVAGPYGGSTAYVLDDNDTCIVRTFREVLALAE